MRSPWIVSAIVCLPLLVHGTADANWLSKLAREVGESGGTVATRTLGAAETAATVVKRMPTSAEAIPIAAHATPEGHWQFVNRSGEVFTAGTPDELRRALPILAPQAGTMPDKVQLYLSEETVFARPQAIAELPNAGGLHIAHGETSFPLIVKQAQPQPKLSAQFRPHLSIELTTQDLFDEAIAHLTRPLNRSNIRTIAFEPGGPARLSSVPLVDARSKTATVDAIDPGQFASALPSLRGQTAVVTGRLDGDLLHIAPTSGPAQTLRTADLVRAAEDADVNLVILDAPSARQPGGRNWLWLKYEVNGLDDALSRASFGDFLEALAARQGGMTVTAAREGHARVYVRAAPRDAAGAETGGGITDAIGSWTGDLIGHVAARAIDVHARDNARQRELDDRIVPGVPAALQYGYIVLLILGLAGWQFSSAWFAKVWPPVHRERYRHALIHWAAIACRFLVFLLLFMPLVGVPAAAATGLAAVWNLVMAPFRAVAWLIGKFRQPAAT